MVGLQHEVLALQNLPAARKHPWFPGVGPHETEDGRDMLGRYEPWGVQLANNLFCYPFTVLEEEKTDVDTHQGLSVRVEMEVDVS